MRSAKLCADPDALGLFLYFLICSFLVQGGEELAVLED